MSQSFNAEQSRATTRIVPSGSESSPDSDFAFLVRKKVSDLAWGCAIAACRAGRWFSGCPQCYPVRMSRAIELLGAVRERRQLQRQEPRTGGHDHPVRCRPSRALVFDSASSLGWRPGLYAAVPPGLTTCWVRRYPASERRRMPSAGLVGAPVVPLTCCRSNDLSGARAREACLLRTNFGNSAPMTVSFPPD